MYNKSGTEPMSVNEWLESKQDSHSHWWAKSIGGGAIGGRMAGGKRIIPSDDFSSGRLTEKDLQDINSGRAIIQ